MAAGNLARSLELIFGHEGGFTDNRADPGNWTGGAVGSGSLHGTKFGIAANTYPDLDIRNLTIGQATDIYRRDYAAKVRFDDLPPGLDYAMLDFAINSGPSRAAKYLQRVVGAADDGQIGPGTLAAVARADVKATIGRLCDKRLAFMQQLATWPKFGRGWTTRVESVRAESLKMAGA